jgi:hypothetical protein
MVALKTSEHDHIKKLGPKKWNTAHTAAMRAVLKNDRMTGMDKIRMALVTKAALKGTGYDIPAFLVPTIAGRPSQAVQDIADAAFAEAVDAVAASNWRTA